MPYRIVRGRPPQVKEKTMKRLALLAAIIAAPGFVAIPAAAQDQAGDKVNTVIVYGDDECPESTGGDIVVCARMDESERYRIPEALRFSDDPANSAWASRVKSFETVGNFGPMSCTPVGAGGELGCTVQNIARAFEEKRTGSNVRAGELIAAQRAERLSTIDTEAAETQARVEAIEKEYLERAEREENGQAAPRPPSDTPVVVEPSDIAPK